MSSHVRPDLHQFENDAYARCGQPESFDEVAATIGKISEIALTGWQNIHTLSTTIESVWEQGSDAMRRFIAIGSVAVNCWPQSYKRTPDMAVQFGGPDELKAAARATDDSELAATSLIAVGNQFNASFGYTPSSFAKWAAAVSEIAGDSQQSEVNSTLDSIIFSDHPTDSEDMSDQHQVDKMLHNESLPTAFRLRLMNLAIADAKTTRYKPHVWQSQINVTLRDLAKSTHNPLRFAAREELELPTADDEFHALREEERQNRAQEEAERQAAKEVLFAAEKGRINRVIDEVMRRSRATS